MRSVGVQAAAALVAAAAVLLVQGPSLAQEADLGLLVSYSFDEERLDSGPDTFSVFESSKGTVNLTSHYRLSGYTAIEIRDVRGDHEFPELQGYFPVRDSGRLWAHFALLLTDPREELNIALAGPQWFRLGKDGIAFWLTTRDGYLTHVSDSIPKKIFQPRPFVWYHVDLEIDLEGGVYDLRIEEEGSSEPVVELLDQQNAASQPGSAVDKFSFIGDRGQDTSNVVYYVDDVALAVGERVEMEPLVAPGRRRLFVDQLDDLRDEGLASCLPARDLADYGVTPELARRLGEGGAAASLAALTRLGEESSSDPAVEPLVRAHRAWSQGCRHLARGEIEAAVAALETAVDLVETSRVYEAAFALALAHAGEVTRADEWLSWLEEEWLDDPRLPALVARMAVAKGDAEGARARLATEAYAHLDGSRSGLSRRGGELSSLEYYALLLWLADFDEAQSFALAMAARFEPPDGEPGRWLERAGDAAFHAGAYGEALDFYERVLSGRASDRVLLKLSDVHFRRGDLDAERELREAIYGSLSFD